MSWFRRHIGIDGFELFLQAAITIALMAWAGSEGNEEAIGPIVVSSLVVLGVRRAIGRRKMDALPSGHQAGGLTSGEMTAARFDDVDQRVADLEMLHSRVAELEERVDFAERLLAERERLALPEHGAER